MARSLADRGAEAPLLEPSAASWLAQQRAWVTAKPLTSMIPLPSTFTARASGRRRWPWHAWQGLAAMYRSISLRM